jgi:hypothetical protein
MTYAYDLENGQRLMVQNDGGNTIVALSSGDEGQQQSQSTGFTTGKWSKTPELFRTRGNLILRVEGKVGCSSSESVAIKSNQCALSRTWKMPTG